MKKHYYYQTIGPMDYDEWAEAASQSGRTPVLPENIARRLEAIFSRERKPTLQEYQEDLRWLSGLEWELRYVWASTQREASGIGSLVEDYRSALDL